MPTSERQQRATPSLVSSAPRLFDDRAYVRFAQLALETLFQVLYRFYIDHFSDDSGTRRSDPLQRS